jgi:hypothetical protein
MELRSAWMTADEPWTTCTSSVCGEVSNTKTFTSRTMKRLTSYTKGWCRASHSMAKNGLTTLCDIERPTTFITGQAEARTPRTRNDENDSLCGVVVTPVGLRPPSVTSAPQSTLISIAKDSLKKPILSPNKLGPPYPADHIFAFDKAKLSRCMTSS